MEDRFNLSNYILVLNGLGGHVKHEKNLFKRRGKSFPRLRFKKSESQADLTIVSRPTLDSREENSRESQERNETSYRIFRKRYELDLVSKSDGFLRECVCGHERDVYI